MLLDLLSLDQSVRASLSKSEASDAIVSTAAVAVHGASSVLEAGDTISATGRAAIHAAASITEAADTEAETAKVAIHANANLAEAADTLSATGIVGSTAIHANASLQEAADAISATATAPSAQQSAMAYGGSALWKHRKNSTRKAIQKYVETVVEQRRETLPEVITRPVILNLVRAEPAVDEWASTKARIIRLEKAIDAAIQRKTAAEARARVKAEAMALQAAERDDEEVLLLAA